MEKEKKEAIEVVDGTVETSLGEVVEDDTILVLKKPITFEGKEYKKIDLSELENITAKDMVEIGKILDKGGSISFAPETTLWYACIIASRAAKLPIELLNMLGARDALRLKNKVIGFLYGQD